MTVENKKSRKRLLILGIAVLVAIAGVVALDSLLQRIVAQKLRSSLPGDRLCFSSLHIHLWRSSVEIGGLSISLKPTRSPSIIGQYAVYFSTVRLRGVHFFEFLWNKKLVIESLYLNKGQVILDEDLLQDKTVSFSGMASHMPPFRYVLIKSMNLDDISVWLQNKKHRYRLANGSFRASDLGIPSVSTVDSLLKGMQMHSFTASLQEASYLTGSYKLQLKKCKVYGNKKLMNAVIDTLRSIPLYTKAAFSRRLGYQTDRIESTVTEAEFKNIHTLLLLKNELRADEISIKHSDFSVYRDRRLPRRKDVQPLPAAMLRKSPLHIHIKTVRILNSSVAYEEYPKDGHHSGTLTVKRLSVFMAPLISHPLPSDPSQMMLRAEGSLMGSGKIYTTMYLPFHSDRYTVQGAFHDLDLTTLNSVSENLGKIHIKSGFLDSLGFRFRFTEQKATGTIVGIYHQLIIEPLKGNDDHKKIAKLKSFMLRRLVIPLNKDRNMPERKRSGKIDYRRDPTRMVSFYLLQSLLTGIKSSFTLGFLLPK